MSKEIRDWLLEENERNPQTTFPISEETQNFIDLNNQIQSTKCSEEKKSLQEKMKFLLKRMGMSKREKFIDIFKSNKSDK